MEETMSKHIRVENDQVVECLDYLPQNATGDWRIAVEVEPSLIEGRQIRGSHSFDLTKSPVEIVWSVIDLTVNDRKEELQQRLNQDSYEIVHGELIKEFEGQNSEFELVQAAIVAYRTKRAEIAALTTHEEIDAFILANG
jgi:hypothetical protein